MSSNFLLLNMDKLSSLDETLVENLEKAREAAEGRCMKELFM